MSGVIETKDEAIDRVEEHADAEWKDAAYLACCFCAEIFPRFTTDMLWDMMDKVFYRYETHEPRAMGAIMRRAARDKIIAATALYVRSDRPQCHGRPVAVWESLICDNEEEVV